MNKKHSILIFILVLVIFLFSVDCTNNTKPVTEPGIDSTTDQKKQNDSDDQIKNTRTQAIDEKSNLNPAESTPTEILENALEAYQEAQTAWESADIETALDALDEAYALILKLKLAQDSPLVQEKNDLRLLIAQRIQEIYASHLIAVGNNNREIPLVENKYVNAEIKSFQTREHQYFLTSYRRSGRYIQMIRRELKKEGLPEDLAWIPIIESGFKIRAYSRARALGLWQFIASTGYRFGLKRDRWIDERMDPEKATRAAVKYLKELHSFFGDWTTALASYNCGEFRVQRLIRAQKNNYFDNFWDLFTMLPRETARFVPRFIATLLIIKNPEKYGFTLPEPEKPQKHEIINTSRPIRLSTFSKALGLPENILADMNPELRHKSTPEREYILKIPNGLGKNAMGLADTLPKWIPATAYYTVHYVRRGETVSAIARRYRTSISAIAKLNRLRRNFLIRPGQRLKVPGRRAIAQRSTPRPVIRQNRLHKGFYTVKHGDSLARIATAFNTSVEQIKKDNSLKSNNISIGQKLTIRRPRPQGAITYTVKHGDTPYTIARNFGMSLNRLLQINSLSKRSKIFPGQSLWVIQKENSSSSSIQN